MRPAMAFAFRILVYLGGGGAILAWLSPRPGLAEATAIASWIAACALADRAVERLGAAGAAPGAPKGRFLRGGHRHTPDGARRDRPDGGERRVPRHLYATPDLDEAESLLGLLRGRGLHPVLVSQRTEGAAEGVSYEIRVVEGEWPKSQSLLARFPKRRA
jgi:hypothetical protein